MASLMQLYAAKLHDLSLQSWSTSTGQLAGLQPPLLLLPGVALILCIVPHVKILYLPIPSGCGCFYTSTFSFALLDLEK